MTVDSEDAEPEEDPDEVLLGNGDTLSERVDQIDLDALDEEDTCTTDELRDRLDLWLPRSEGCSTTGVEPVVVIEE